MATMSNGPYEKKLRLVDMADVPSPVGQAGKVLALNVLERFFEWIQPGGNVSNVVSCGVANTDFIPSDNVSCGDADSTGFPISCGGAA